MYISAQRVQAAPRDGSPGPQGINAFYYQHGPDAWRGAPPEGFLPESNPGVLADSSIELPPPGNRVRSFLDILAPDGATMASLVSAVAAAPRTEALPFSWTVGDVWCRFGAELALAPQWRRELQRLFARAALLYREQSPP